MKYLQEAVAHDPLVVSGRRGARIRGRSRASMLDAIGVVKYLQEAVARAHVWFQDVEVRG